MEMAGVEDFSLCEIEDGKLIANRPCFEKINFSLYSFIFLPNPNDHHSDHTAAYEYALEAIKKQQVQNARIFQYEVHNPLAEVNCHVDITDVVNQKQQLFECYVSQREMHPYGQQIRSLAGYRGYQNEEIGKYLEAYLEIKLEEKNNVSVGMEIELAKYKLFTKILLQWVEIEHSFGSIAEYFAEKGYVNVAIYGYGQIGKLLYKMLQGSACRVEYIIDKNTGIEQSGVCIYHETTQLKKVDVVIVTAMLRFEEIAQELWDNNKLQSVSIENVIMDMERRFI